MPGCGGLTLNFTAGDGFAVAAVDEDAGTECANTGAPVKANAADAASDATRAFIIFEILLEIRFFWGVPTHK